VLGLLMSGALAGCGGGSGTTGDSSGPTAGAAPGTSDGGANPGTSDGGSAASDSTTASQESLPEYSLNVSVPALKGGRFPKSATCHGADRSPEVRWGALPKGTKEVALFVIDMKPVDGKLVFDWAATGIKPSTRRLAAGAHGTLVEGRNSHGEVGYDLCPPAGSGDAQYVVRVVALPSKLDLENGFSAQSGYEQTQKIGTAFGLAIGTYGG